MHWRATLSLYLCLLVLGLADNAHGGDKLSAGRSIYKQRCASCHGAKGEGVEGAAEEPLRGARTVAELAKVIAETMPEDEPTLCVGDDAEQVATFIHQTFYSSPSDTARIQLSRLTARQYRNSVADLIASFTGEPRVGDERGLQVEWFDSRGFNGNKRVERRIDGKVDYNFEEGKPHSKISKPNEFSARWEGSLLADRAGDYEFIVRTENGVRLWVNDREDALIDAWVSSQGRPQEHRAVIQLLAGRPYYLRLEFFKFKEPSASIQLRWKAPGKVETVVPTRHLSPTEVAPLFVPTAPFPPDDRVSGYERGIGISDVWDQATMAAAIEAADYIANNIDRLANTKRGGSDRVARIKAFFYDFASRAFRRPLSADLRSALIDVHFEQADSVETAAKRATMFVLKSPRFLYPELGGFRDQWTVASRLALCLWDSLPDEPLRNAARDGHLKTQQQVGAQARRMLNDRRAKTKLRYFLDDWLPLNDGDALPKDERFEGFDEQLASDLRTSLEMFVDDVVWSEKSDYRRLLVDEKMFVNQRLAEFYDLETVEDERFVPVAAPHRLGVLTHPYTMSALAYSHLSSPIHRGVFVTRRLLGRDLKPPPQATEFKDADFDAHLSTREKVSLLTEATACQTCHAIINPLGFSLEHFDAVGRYREMEGDKPIDATANFETVQGVVAKLDGANSLAQLIAENPHSHAHFVDQLFHQAVKQPINAFGTSTRSDLVRAFTDDEFHIRNLLAEIARVAAMHEIE